MSRLNRIPGGCPRQGEEPIVTMDSFCRYGSCQRVDPCYDKGIGCTEWNYRLIRSVNLQRSPGCAIRLTENHVGQILFVDSARKLRMDAVQLSRRADI